MFVAMNWLIIVFRSCDSSSGLSSRSSGEGLVSSTTFSLTSGKDIVVVEIVELVGLLDLFEKESQMNC